MVCDYCEDESVTTIFDEDEDKEMQVCEAHWFEIEDTTPEPVDSFFEGMALLYGGHYA